MLALTSPSNELTWSKTGALTVTGTSADAGIGVASIHVQLDNNGALTAAKYDPPNQAPGDFSQTVNLMKNGSFADGTYTIRVWAKDGLGNTSEPLERTVVLDTVPPDLKLLTTWYLDETAAHAVAGEEEMIFLEDGAPQVPIGTSCCGKGCLIRKFPQRLGYESPKDIKANNLPYLNPDVQDESVANGGSVRLEYRVHYSGDSSTEYRPVTAEGKLPLAAPVA